MIRDQTGERETRHPSDSRAQKNPEIKDHVAAHATPPPRGRANGIFPEELFKEHPGKQAGKQAGVSDGRVPKNDPSR
jgi:hypothetical protein